MTVGHKWDANLSQQRLGAVSDPPLIFSLFFNFCSKGVRQDAMIEGSLQRQTQKHWATAQAAVFEAFAVRNACKFWGVECLFVGHQALVGIK